MAYAVNSTRAPSSNMRDAVTVAFTGAFVALALALYGMAPASRLLGL